MIFTVEEVDVSTPSETWKVKLSVPLKLAVGTYQIQPVEVNERIPFEVVESRIYVRVLSSGSLPVTTPE